MRSSISSALAVVWGMLRWLWARRSGAGRCGGGSLAEWLLFPVVPVAGWLIRRLMMSPPKEAGS